MTAVLYRGIADDLRETVRVMSPGERLPSEHDLVKEYRVSRQTVRSALAALANEGLITSTRGRGWAVRNQHALTWHASDPERNLDTDVSPADSWSHGIRAQGQEPREQITVETTLATGRIAELLDVNEGEPVVVRRRLRWVDRQLMTTADTYYPRSLVAGTAIELPSDVLPGTYAVLEAAGHGWRTRRDTIRSRPPTAAESDLFGLGPGVAVAEHVRVRCTESGRVVAVTITALPGDRNTIIYEGKS
jgi:GntR family transcriptional regulator